jgi:PAS domain S-box-containing protein
MNEKTRILVVDDDPHLLQGMSRILKSAGYETIEAANGTECLRFTIEQKPDLVLLDVMLPDINGVEVCKRIKSDKTLSNSYVVLLSSLRTSSDDQAEGLETGADGYIARPVSNRELLARVESLLRLKRSEQALKQSEERFRRISSLTSDISYSCTKSNNAAYSIDWIMGAVEQITGHSEDDVKALGCWRDLVFDEDLPIFDSKVIGLAPGTSASCELRLAHNTGKVVWVASFAECALDKWSPDSLRLYGALVDITERKLAEEALAETNKRYRLIAETIHDCFWMATPDIGKIVYVSPAYEKIWGRSCESLYESPTSFIDAIHSDDRDQVIHVLDQHRSEVTSWNAIYRIVWPDGSIRWIEDRGFPVLDENGKWYLNIGVATDITERKRAEEELLNQKQVMEVILDNVPAMMVFYDAQGHCRYVNRCLQETLGWSQEELGSRNLLEECYPDPDYRDYVVNYIASAKGTWGDFSTLTRYGNQIDTSWANLALPDGSGIGIGIDITELKQAEQELRKFKTITDKANYGAAMIDLHGFLTYMNESFANMHGFSSPELIGKNLSVFHTDEQMEHVNRLLEKLYRDGVFELQEVWHVKKDGTVFLTLMNAVVLKNDEGTPIFLSVTAIDITERKLAEEALRESEDKFSKAFHLNPDAITITRFVDGIIVSANEGVQKILGFAEDELIGKSALEINIWDSPEDRNRWIEKLKAEGKVANFEARFRTKDGGIRYGLISASIIELNRAPHILTVARDITERVQAEEERESLRSQLLQAQKMEAIGILAGGVAHDFNNLLQIALGYSEILLNDKSPDHPDYDKLHTINTSAKRGADLVQRLMVFSRKGDTKPRALDLNHEVTQIKKLLDRTIPKMIAIELSLESWLPVINADPVQVEQILLNLAINAKDAMSEAGGKLTIETRNVTLDEEYCRTHLEAKQGQYVMISVSDTGHGMSQETMQHIFEPFFTTKGAGKGTGLGLAIVFGIMKHHEGFINCYSEIGHGTTFRIYFPVVQTELEEDLEQESAVPQGGSETILLVDDEESLCDIGSQILTRAGYTVLTATNGKDALNLYGKKRSDISLVLLDLIMPEMGGKECFQELVNINPKVRVILSSGFLSNGTTEEARVFGFRGFVEKPYNMRQLLHMVREVLDED